MTDTASLALFIGLPAQDVGVGTGVGIVAGDAGDHVVTGIGGPVEIHQGKGLLPLAANGCLDPHRVAKVSLAALELRRRGVAADAALRDGIQVRDRRVRLAVLPHHAPELARPVVGVVLVAGGHSS
jgi:hypothetical protein